MSNRPGEEDGGNPWRTVSTHGMPPVDAKTVFVGQNSAGYIGCFNEVSAEGHCLMMTPEGSAVIMSDLAWWRVQDLPPVPCRRCGGHGWVMVGYGEAAGADACPACVSPAAVVPDIDVAKVMRRAYRLGQVYWQQADSESYTQQRKSDETQGKFDQLLAETVAALAAPGAAAAAPEPRNYWADLWYFVMDEAALDFESIVTNHQPKHWLGEAHKLFRAKHPARAAQAQGGKA